METDLQLLKTNFKSQVDEELKIDDYIDFDQQLWTNQSTIFDKDIICKVLNHLVEESSDEGDDGDAGVAEMTKWLTEEVKSAIGMLEKFSLYSDFGEDILKSIR